MSEKIHRGRRKGADSVVRQICQGGEPQAARCAAEVKEHIMDDKAHTENGRENENHAICGDIIQIKKAAELFLCGLFIYINTER